MIRSGVDTYILYTLVKRIATPFKEWKAYKAGIIDEKGNFIVAKRNRTPEQYSSMTYLDIFILNLKRNLERLPGMSNRLLTYAGALYLIKEDRHIKFDMLTEDGAAVAPMANTSSDNVARSSQKEAEAFKKKKLTRTT